MELTLSVRSFQVPPTPFTCAWPPSLPSVPTSRATRVTSEAKELSWSTIVLMVFLSSRISPFTSTVIFLERSPLATAVVTWAMFRTWAVRLPAMRVHVVGQVLPGAAHALHPGLAAQLALGADFAGHAGDLRGERAELVHHRVHRLADPEELAHQRPAFDVERHRLREVALGHGADDAGHLAGGLHQVADQGVDRVDRCRPGSGRAVQVRPLGDLAFLADRLADPLELAGGFPVEIDDVVQGVGDLSRDTHLRHRHLDARSRPCEPR